MHIIKGFNRRVKDHLRRVKEAKINRNAKRDQSNKFKDKVGTRFLSGCHRKCRGYFPFHTKPSAQDFCFLSSILRMATIFGCPPSLSHPLARTYNFSSSSKTPPPPNSPSQSESSDPYPQLTTTSSDQQQQPAPVKVEKQKPSRRAASTVETTDWIASSLTRRFGLGAGLAWAAFLAFGVVSEQIKTRLEVSQQEANTRDVEKQEEVVLPNGIRYHELRIGGGASPRTGDLVVIDLKGAVQGSGQVFVDTFGGDNKKPLALVMGSRPYSRGMCEGIEYVLRSMKAGGKRRVIVPPSLGFGENGAELGSGVQIPPSATLEYVVEVDKVSIAPA